MVVSHVMNECCHRSTVQRKGHTTRKVIKLPLEMTQTPLRTLLIMSVFSGAFPFSQQSLPKVKMEVDRVLVSVSRLTGQTRGQTNREVSKLPLEITETPTRALYIM